MKKFPRAFAFILLVMTGALLPTPLRAQTTIIYAHQETNTTDYNTSGNPLTLSIALADFATQSGYIYGTGGITKVGDGTLILQGTNTYSGLTTVDAGTLVIGLDSTRGSLAGAVSLNAGTLLLFYRSNDVAQNHPITGAGTLMKRGAGSLDLTGNNTYTGGTRLEGGILGIGSDAALGTGDLTITRFGANGLSAIGGTHTLANTVTVDNDVTFSGSNALTLSGAVTLMGNREFIVTNTAATILAGVISESGGARMLTKSGAGELVLNGANTYTGGTTLNAGTLGIGSDAALNTGGLTINGGGLSAIGGARTLANTVTVTGDATFSGSNALTLSGAVTLTGNREFTVTNTAVTLLAGAIGESGGASMLTKSGAGELVLSGANTYTGGTTLNAGTLGIGSDSALNTGALTINGGTLQTSGAARTLANTVTVNGDVTFAGSNALTLSGAFILARNRELTVSNSALTTISGIISQSGGGRGLNKYGTGELQLTGANTYTGGTYIGAGTVRINNTAGSAFGTGAVTVEAGATLAGAGSFTGALQLNGMFSPGNSPGTATTGSQTWAGGGGYIWEINNATGLAGTSYDLLSISGTLTIAATAGNKFTLSLVSLLANHDAGDVVNFNSAVNSSYMIASATGGIIGFDVNAFTINATGFTNNLNGGSWNLSQSGNNLNLNFASASSAIPEPSTYAIFAGFAVLGLAVWRKRS